jgi:bifunctional non-homologous end joining protein LigD
MLPLIEPLVPTDDISIAKSVVEDPSLYDFEQKWDGIRCTAYVEGRDVTLRSKKKKILTGFHPLGDRLRDLRKLGVENAIFDGEIVALDSEGNPDFNRLMRREGRIAYCIFDFLMLNDVDMRSLEFRERKKLLKRFMTKLVREKDSVLRYVEACKDKAAKKLVTRVRTGDLEGVVAKLKKAPYDPSILNNWVKIIKPGYTQYKGRWKWFQKDES